jgi:hypothetical protein
LPMCRTKGARAPCSRLSCIRSHESIHLRRHR